MKTPVVSRAPSSRPFEELSIDTLYIVPEEKNEGNMIAKILIVVCTVSGYLRLVKLLKSKSKKSLKRFSLDSNSKIILF